MQNIKQMANIKLLLLFNKSNTYPVHSNEWANLDNIRILDSTDVVLQVLNPFEAERTHLDISFLK